MEVNIDPAMPAHGSQAVPTQSFVDDEGAKSTVAFAIGSSGITAGGLLAWFAFGSVLASVGTGTLALIGFLTLLGVLAVLGMMAHDKWG